jgi:hypothetical protein
MATKFRAFVSKGVFGGILLGAACSSSPTVPANPNWADVAPILRGSCDGCHGWTAKTTGASFRFDFYDVTSSVCGDAALAIDQTLILAGSPLAATNVQTVVVPQNGAKWARMPPQPSPALYDWEVATIGRWAAQPVKGPPPTGNRPPTIVLDRFPATADKQLAFTAVLDDPDGDPAIGVLQVAGFAFLMNRSGSFGVSFNSSAWPTGAQEVTATLCDGWQSSTTDLGPVQIQH